MATQLVVFIATLALSNADLLCKGVEYDIAGITHAVPADVCLASVTATSGGTTVSSSTMLKCENNEIIQQTYPDVDCTGDATSSIPIAQMYSTADWVTSYCNINLPECEYIKVRSYFQAFVDQNDCNSFDPSTDHEGYAEITYIKDYCGSMVYASSKYTCDNNNIASYNVYNYVSDCSNTPIVTHYSGDFGCVTDGTNAATVAVEGTCGTAVNTGGNTVSSSTPTPTGPGAWGTSTPTYASSTQSTGNPQNNNACSSNVYMTLCMLLCFCAFSI